MSSVQLDDNIHVAVNEQRNNIYVINRCLSKLLNNDKKILSLYEELLGNLQIQSYSSGNKYKENDLVWFVEGTNLYILRCISNESDYPKLNKETQSFEDSGWQNEMEYIHILKIGADKIIKTYINNNIIEHSLNESFHRHGRISIDSTDKDYIQNKILNRDLGFRTNIGAIDVNRKTVHFPYQTVSLKPDTSILQGYYRKYDCGLIEYDIIFKFGMTNETQETIYGQKNVISCNNVTLNTFNNILNSSSDDSQNNMKYYYGQCTDIFNINNAVSGYNSIIGNTIQVNRNDYINTYFANINLPQTFFNMRYNVYISDMTSQTSDSSKINYSPNVMTVCDKTLNSFKILYITYPLASEYDYNIEGQNARLGGLAINSYHCQVVGRWR